MMSAFALVLVFSVFVIDAGFFVMTVAAISFAPWVPSLKKDLSRALKLAEPKKGEVLYDLGCGNGTVVVWAASHYPIRAVGIEIAWPVFWLAKIRQRYHALKKDLAGTVEFRRKNLFYADISDADIIYVFGMPKQLAQKLRPKLEKELRKGARVVSNIFSIEGWVPDVIDHPPGKNPVYLYIKK